MGVIRGAMGHMGVADLDKMEDEFRPILVEGEHLLAVYKLIRDMFVFTDRRFMIVDKQGLTAMKVDYQTVPYSSVARFTKQSAAVADLDAELKIWVYGRSEPIVKEFKRDGCVNEVYQLLTEGVIGAKGFYH